VVLAKVAILADSFGIHRPFWMATLVSHFSATLCMIAVEAHPLRIVRVGWVRALRYFLFALWRPFLFWLDIGLRQFQVTERFDFSNDWLLVNKGCHRSNFFNDFR
jgi:hypothetical protein